MVGPPFVRCPKPQLSDSGPIHGAHEERSGWWKETMGDVFGTPGLVHDELETESVRVSSAECTENKWE